MGRRSEREADDGRGEQPESEGEQAGEQEVHGLRHPQRDAGVQVTLTLTLTLTLTQHLRHPQRDADERGDGGRHPGHLGEDGVEDADGEEERAWLGLGSGLGLGLGLELGLG